nr:MAG TPA: hypothetical protein [Caudoviricetes sp.]
MIMKSFTIPNNKSSLTCNYWYLTIGCSLNSSL